MRLAYISGIALALATVAPSVSWAGEHGADHKCACDEKCEANCKAGKGEECKCSECSCKEGKCSHGKCAAKAAAGKKTDKK